MMDPNGDVQVVRIKDRIAHPLDSGYRDVLLNLKVAGCDVVMELQLHLKDVIALKQDGHRIYGESATEGARLTNVYAWKSPRFGSPEPHVTPRAPHPRSLAHVGLGEGRGQGRDADAGGGGGGGALASRRRGPSDGCRRWRGAHAKQLGWWCDELNGQGPYGLARLRPGQHEAVRWRGPHRHTRADRRAAGRARRWRWRGQPQQRRRRRRRRWEWRSLRRSRSPCFRGSSQQDQRLPRALRHRAHGAGRGPHPTQLDHVDQRSQHTPLRTPTTTAGPLAAPGLQRGPQAQAHDASRGRRSRRARECCRHAEVRVAVACTLAPRQRERDWGHACSLITAPSAGG